MYNKFKEIYIMFKKVIFMGGIGCIVLIITLIMEPGVIQTFLSTIASYFIVSSILDVVNRCYAEKELIYRVCDCINGEGSATKLGVSSIGIRYEGITNSILNEAEETLDIVHVYGGSWTRSNRAAIIETLEKKVVNVRVILIDYEIEALRMAYNNQYSNRKIDKEVEEILKEWEEIYKLSGKNNNLRIYLFNGLMNNAIYLNEKSASVLHFSSTRERYKDNMTIIKCSNKKDGLYSIYKDQVNNMILESREYFIE